MTKTPARTYPEHARALLVLGLPLIGGHMAQFAIGLSDSIMLGWYGAEALAAVTLAVSYLFVFVIFGSGFAWAVMPMVAAFEAESDETGLRRATRMGLWLSMLFAVLAMPFMIWSEPVLLALGQTEAVARDAALYLDIAGWGLFPALGMMLMKSYLAALEHTRVVFWSMVFGAVLNALANYVLIFGAFGFPEMGLRGAAIASVVTQIAMLAAIVAYAIRALPQHGIFVRLWRPDWEMLARVFRLGLPIGVTGLAEVSLFAISAVMMGWLGTVALAAHGIAIQLASATFMIHMGISNAATVRAGNALGRRDRDGLGRGAIVASVLSLVVAIATIIVFLLVPELLVGAFLDPAEPARAEIVALGITLLAIAALFQLVDGAQVIALGLLRGVQDTGVPMAIAAFSYIFVGLSLSYLLGFVLEMGATGIWLGLVVGLALAAVLLMVRFWTRAIALVAA